MEMFIVVISITLLIVATFLCGYSIGWDKAMLDVAREELEKTQKDIEKFMVNLR